MELKPNMYVRTIKGIFKINEVIDNGVITYEDDFGREWEEETGRKVIRYIDKDGWNCGLDEKDILKASYNIIDLIEVGDYVNGTKVTSISGTRYDKSDLHCYCDYCQNEKTGKWLMIPAKDIKSIVTKEQMKAMEYKVVE